MPQKLSNIFAQDAYKLRRGHSKNVQLLKILTQKTTPAAY